jgi:glycosyltransferase involved in cell wall biosynthesis
LESASEQPSKPRICWFSNSPLGVSAYSKITKVVTNFLHRQGIPVCVAVNWGHEGAELEVEGVKLYPRIGAGMSERWAVEAAKDFKADMMITLYDAWSQQTLGQWLRQASLPDVAYTMFDHSSISPPLMKRLTEAFEIITPTKYGETLCNQAQITNVTRIPFGCDTKIYQPLPISRADLRASLNFKDYDFVFGIFAMTRIRKGIPYALDAIRLAMDSNPDLKAGIYIHGLPSEEYDLMPILDQLQLTQVTRFPEEYHYHLGWEEIKMAKSMASCDVLVNACFGGGFELTTVESFATGTPVVANNHTSFIETIGPVTPELLAPPLGEFWVETIPAKVYLPNVEKMGDILDHLMNIEIEASYRDKLRQHSLQYDWETQILPKWIPYVGYLSQQIEARCIKIPEPTQLLREKALKMMTIE